MEQIEKHRKIKDKKGSASKSYKEKSGREKSGISQNKARNKTDKRERQLPCPVAKRCGSCQYLHLTYQQQLKVKEDKLTLLLKDICPLKGMLGMENPYHYRNKVHAAFGCDRKGRPVSGIYEAGTHNIVPAKFCLIEDWQSSTGETRRIWQCSERYKVKGVLGCSNRHIDENTVRKIYFMAWNKLLECRDALLPEWEEKAQSEDLLARFRAVDFMELTEHAQPIQELDVDLMLRILDHIKVYESGVAVIVFLNGTEIEYKAE